VLAHTLIAELSMILNQNNIMQYKLPCKRPSKVQQRINDSTSRRQFIQKLNIALNLERRSPRDGRTL
jgi:hypothetical protein